MKVLNRLLLFALFLSAAVMASAQVTIWSEDFGSYANGTSNAPKFSSSAGDCDDGGILNDNPSSGNGNWWGVANGQFVCRDIEGQTCCTPDGGANDNELLTEVIDIDEYCNVQASIDIGAIGQFECTAGGPYYTCTGTAIDNGQDQVVVEYSLSGGPWTQFPGGYICGSAGVGTLTVTGLNGGTLQIRITLGNKANAEIYTVDNIVVQGFEKVPPTPPVLPNYCESLTNVTLPSSLSGPTGTIPGTWSGTGVTPPNTFNPSSAGVGTHTLTFTPNPGVCALPVDVDVTVVPAAPVNLAPIGPFCETVTSVPLSTNQGGITGTWSGPGVSGNVFNPSSAGAGTHTLTFTPGVGQCALPATIDVTVQDRADLNLPSIGPFCTNSPIQILSNSYDGYTGTWSGPGISGINFNPFAAGAGIHTLTFTPSPGQCANVGTITVEVVLATPVTYPTIGPFCSTDPPFNLPTVVDGFTGYWVGPGIVGNVFNPASAGPGNHLFAFVPDPGQCKLAGSQFVLVTAPNPIVVAPVGPFCENAAPQSLPANPSGATGSWSGPGVTGNTFDPASAGPGSHVLTFTPDPGQCFTPATLTVVVTLEAVINLAPLGPYCASGASVPLGSNQGGFPGSWSGPGVAGNNFNPGVAGPGVHTLTFTPNPGLCAGPASIDVTVNAPAPVVLAPIGPFCESGPLVPLGGTQNGFVGTWSGPGVSANNFNPSTAGVGSHTLTFTPSPGQCAQAGTVDVTVTPAAPVVLAPLGPFCVTGPLVPLATNQGGITGTWSGPGVSGNTFNPATAGEGTHTLTFTPSASQCAAPGTVDVTVNDAPEISPDPLGPFCSNANPVALPGIQNGIPGSWSGPGVVANQFRPQVAGPGIHILTFTPSAGQCASAGSIQVEVNAPEPVSPNPIGPFCESSFPVTLLNPVNGVNGNWSGPGVSGNNFSPAAAGAGVAVLTFTPTPGQCFTPGILDVTVEAAPFLVIDSIVCDPSLTTYTVSINTSATNVIANAGIVGPNPNGGYDISQIPVTVNVAVTVSTLAGCTASVDITAPDCSCPGIPAPTGNNLVICAGDPVPTLTASAQAGMVIDWYAVPNGGAPLLSNSNTFTPASAGTYYAEARDPSTGCVSGVRRAISVIANNPPSYTLGLIQCSNDLQTWSVSFTTSAINVVPSTGTISGGSGNYTVTLIPTGTNLTLTFTDAVPCTSTVVVNAPQCTCPPIPAPTAGPNVEVCEGQAIPALTATVLSGLVIDWYSAATGGTLLLSGNGSFNASATGTYYAEARDPLTGCISSTRVGITLSIQPLPGITAGNPACTADLSAWGMSLGTETGNTVVISAGTLTGSAGSFNVANVPAGVSLTLIVNTPAGCADTLVVTAPNCNCPSISAPVSGGNVTVCEGQSIPPLSASTGNGLVIDWYAVPNGGTPLLQNSNTYSAIGSGTWYAEARDPVTNCVSSLRTPVSLTVHPLPNFQAGSSTCAPNLQTWEYVFSSNAATITVSAGSVSSNNGSHTVNGVPSGTGITIYLSSTQGCRDTIQVAALNCNCPGVALPVAGSNVSYCEGQPIPAITATVTAPLVIDWYASATGGSPVLQNSSNYTPAGPGTWYAESRDPLTGCVSASRVAVTVTRNPLPTYQELAITCQPAQGVFVLSFATSAATVLVSAGTLSGSNGNYTISNVSGSTVLQITLINAGTQCERVITVQGPDCNCPTLADPISSGNPNICQGASMPQLAVSVTGNLVVDWFATLGSTTPLVVNSLTYTPAAPGTYYAQARDPQTGCTSKRIPVTINVVPNPQIQIDSVVCRGGNNAYDIFFSTNADSVRLSTGVVVVLSGPRRAILGIPEGQNISITVLNTTTGCSSSEQVISPNCNCTPLPAPVSGGNVSICDSEPFNGLSASTQVGWVIDWYANAVGGIALLHNSNTYLPASAGTYYAEARDPLTNCVSARTPVTLQLLLSPNITINRTECATDLQSYLVEISTNADVIIPSVGSLSGSAGLYLISGIPAGTDLVISLSFNNGTCIRKDTVNAPDCPCPSLNAPVTAGTVNVCAGQPLPALTATTAPGLVTDWYQVPAGGTPLLLASGTYAPSAPGTYYVEARDPVSNCVSIRIPILLNVRTLPTVQPVVQSYCGNTTGQAILDLTALDSLVSPSRHSVVYFYNQGLTQPIATPDAFNTNSARIYAQSYDGFCFSLPAVVDLQIRNSYVVDFRDTFCVDQNVVIGNQTFNAARPAGQVLLKTSNGCDSLVQVALLYYPGIQASLSLDKEKVCLGDSMTVTLNLPNVGSYNVSYELNGSNYQLNGVQGTRQVKIRPVQSGSIQLVEVVAVGNQCEAEIPSAGAQFSVVEIQSDLKIVSDYNGYGIGCEGETNGTLELTYTGGDAPYNFSSNTGQNTPLMTNLGAGTYQVTITDANGCTSVEAATLTAPVAMRPDLSAQPKTCLGTAGRVVINGLNGGVAPYEINFNNTGFEAIATVPYLKNNVEPGVYDVVVRDANGCLVNRTIRVTETIGPLVELGPDTTVALGTEVQLFAQVFGKITSLQWSAPFEGLSCDNCVDPVWTSSRTARITVTVQDSAGCVSTDFMTISIDRTRKIFIPNAFSPNEDGSNDRLMIFGEAKAVKRVKRLAVFDRWGEMLFEVLDAPINDVRLGWNGRLRNLDMNPGVYVAMAEVEFIDGEVELFVQDVTLMR